MQEVTVLPDDQKLPPKHNTNSDNYTVIVGVLSRLFI